jgi:hypothetical protein
VIVFTKYYATDYREIENHLRAQLNIIIVIIRLKCLYMKQTAGLLFASQMNMEDHGGTILAGKTKKTTRRETCPSATLSATKIPYGLIWARTLHSGKEKPATKA